jgi:serine phosphatase RsbU (regulator of sigma subunit)
LLEVALTHAMRSPRSILDAVMAAVQTHADGQPQFDDITMIIARREA